MACRGVLFALTPEQEAGVLRFKSKHDDLVSYISKDIEERWDAEWLCQTDKAWDAIHRALNDSQLNYEFDQPLQGVILGGVPLHGEPDYVVVYKAAPDVRRVAEAVARVTDEELAARYDKIDPRAYQEDKSDGDRAYTVEWFRSVRDFYAKAAAADRPVIFTVDQ